MRRMGSEPVFLGEFEQMVLLAVLQAERTDAGAYGITVFDELSLRAKRRVLRGAVYMTLDRLEKKGLLTSFLTEPTAERGGRAKRCYHVTKPARVALRSSQRALMRLWAGIDLAAEKK
jgi:PadR family transcriptional regulator, regulatory protein PadR